MISGTRECSLLLQAMFGSESVQCGSGPSQKSRCGSVSRVPKIINVHFDIKVKGRANAHTEKGELFWFQGEPPQLRDEP
jgi:hypothetical protein